MCQLWLGTLWINTLEDEMKKPIVYLAGAIESTPDGGVGWRRDITKPLEENGFKVFDPCIETDGEIAKMLGWDEFSIKKWNALKEDNFLQVFKIMHMVVSKDIEAVCNSDILLAKYDTYALTSAGTHGEITLARSLDKLVVILLDDHIGADNIPAWVLGCVDSIYTEEDALLRDLMETYLKRKAALHGEE